jgi:hypothetical protein
MSADPTANIGQADPPPDGAILSRPGDAATVARELVDRAGVDGAARCCHGLGLLGVARQIEQLRAGR